MTEIESDKAREKQEDTRDPFEVLAVRLDEAKVAGAMREYLRFPDLPVELWPEPKKD